METTINRKRVSVTAHCDKTNRKAIKLMAIYAVTAHAGWQKPLGSRKMVKITLNKQLKESDI